MEASSSTSAYLHLSEAEGSPFTESGVRCFPSNGQSEVSEGYWQVFTSNVNESEPESDSQSSKEDNEVFNRFKTIDSLQVIETGEITEAYDIDFDRESLDFSPCLIKEQSLLSEFSTLEFSPFESNDSSEEEPVSKLRTLVSVLKNAIKRQAIRPKVGSATDDVESSDSLHESIPSSFQLPTHDYEGNEVSFRSPSLELCKCEEWLPRSEKQSSTTVSSSIKFKNLADIYLYDDSSEIIRTHNDSTSLLEPNHRYSIPNNDRSKNGNKSKFCTKKVNSILKNRINDNFDVEAENAKNTENIRLGVFLKNFESLEIEKYQNEPGLNELRNIQISNYYANEDSNRKDYSLK